MSLGAAKIIKGAAKELTQDVLATDISGQLSRNGQKRLYESVERSGIPEKIGDAFDRAADAFVEGGVEGLQEQK